MFSSVWEYKSCVEQSTSACDVVLMEKTQTAVTDVMAVSNVTCGSPCDTLPCRNGGMCNQKGLDSYECVCEANFTGKYCEIGTFLISDASDQDLIWSCMEKRGKTREKKLRFAQFFTMISVTFHCFWRYVRAMLNAYTVCTSTQGLYGFCVGPSSWTSLPPHIRTIIFNFVQQTF